MVGLLSCFMFLCLVLMTIYRITTRKKLLCLSTICTGAFAGLLLVNKVLPSNCVLAECKHTGAAYQRLKRNELSIKVNHPLISSVDINYLPSNSPNEDRYALGSLPETCLGLFAVIDGHKTDHCSEHLRSALLPFVAKSLTEKGAAKGPLDIYKEGNEFLNAATPNCDNLDKGIDVESFLKQSFNDLDKNISDESLRIIRLVQNGHSIKELLPMAMRAIAGACALVTMVTNDAYYVASTGDCRAVLGRRDSGAWSAVPLSHDQNAQNKEEVERIKSSHPGEEGTVIVNGRLLGSLMPFRSFGDVEQKWPLKDVETMGQVLLNYKTPPYLTAEPVVTYYHYTSKDKFLILSTDGLWDKLSNDQAVSIVGNTYDGKASKTSLTSFLTRRGEPEPKCCVRENSATALLWEGLGGNEGGVSEMLDVAPQLSRMYRDDMTIIVIHFRDEIK